MAPVITLTTDFGLADGYVAAMKGVILSIAPQATIVDVTHEVPPQDILHGAFVLSTAWAYFPQGSVHVAVIDPGVGTERKAIAIAWRGHVFVGPDNGVLSLALGSTLSAPTRRGEEGPGVGPLPAGAQAHELSDPRYRLSAVSATFHGRDIFAPAAAHLAAGILLEHLGPPLREITYLDIGMPRRQPDGNVEGVIIHIDAFGNAVTNVRFEDVPWGDFEVRAGSARIQGLALAYAERDGPLALWGSSGYLEIAVHNGNAAMALGLVRGDRVRVRPLR